MLEESALLDLNDKQREAVEYTEGAMMIIAGAGAGKTRVLTHRMAYLIQDQQIPEEQILALTFTNKAAKEMRHRVEKLLGKRVDKLWIGTFHSLFTRILRIHAEVLGYTKDFSIYDKEDALALAKMLLKEAQIAEDQCKPGALLGYISYAKRNLQTWQMMLDEEASQRPKLRLGPLYKAYVMACRKAQAMDFDDLLFNTHLLFQKESDIQRTYSEQFRHVLIDEFQDTNQLQYLIAKQLSEVHGNICVVGDDSQSIYGFRGASIENILNFKRHYSQAKSIYLEQNYRSTAHIIGASDSVIQKNTQRLPKNIWTENQAGRPIMLIQAQNDQEEGKLVASAIFEQTHSFRCPRHEIAVLYRTHSQSRALEDALRREGIPYRIYGALSFYQRKEIKDILAYLRLVVNPSDDTSLRRIINFPKRGIGGETLQKILEASQQANCSMWSILEQATTYLDARSVRLVAPVVRMITHWQHLSTDPSANIHDIVQHVIDESGLGVLYTKKDAPEELARWENIESLTNAMRFFAEEKQEAGTLSAFLQEISLLTDADQAKNTHEEAVQLMTVHMAKGLEFRTVFVVGLEENLFPSYHATKSRSELEEERRLLYVAMTRAKEQLFLSYARMRFQYGSLRSTMPSRFLSEINTQNIEESSRNLITSAHANISYDASQRLHRSSSKSSLKRKLVPVRSSSPYEKSLPSFSIKVGMRVEHKIFGVGTVRSLTQETDPKVRVDFEKYGEKTLVLSFAKLACI